MVSLAQVMRDLGFDVPDVTYAVQIHCPIHKGGQEQNPSARLYQDGCFCWVCRRTYTPVTLLAAYHDIPISEAIAVLRERYGSAAHRANPLNPRRILDRAILEAFSCTETLSREARQSATQRLYTAITHSARGDSETSIIEEIAKILTDYWPSLVTNHV